MKKGKEKRDSRAAMGKLSGLIGILCNLLLSGSKLLVGTMAASMSITADGLNNLSDAASSIVTLAGFKLAEKPADKEHPYGHARFEYLASLTVSVMILVIGFELAKSSVEKLLHPAEIVFSALSVWVLVLSILVKAGMMAFNGKMGKRLQSTALLATAADSRNDVLTTGAVLIATVTEHFTGLKIDGVMGILVALFILCSGIKLAKETVSPLLGEGVNPDLRKQLTDYINSCPMILDCHDLMVHDYGPGRRYASIHVEMDCHVDAMVAHEQIDRMERECLEEFETHMVIHYDPVVTDNAELDRLRELVSSLLRKKDERLSLHDFRLICHEHEKLLFFDVMIPDEFQGQEESLKGYLEAALLQQEKERYRLEITFDLETDEA